jgi:hypothetical protein
MELRIERRVIEIEVAPGMEKVLRLVSDSSRQPERTFSPGQPPAALPARASTPKSLSLTVVILQRDTVHIL